MELFSYQNFFRPKNLFLFKQFCWTNIVFGPIIFSTQNILNQKFLDQNFFGSKIFLDQKLFWTNNFFNQKFLVQIFRFYKTKIFFGQHFFLTQHFYPPFFLTKNFSDKTLFFSIVKFDMAWVNKSVQLCPSQTSTNHRAWVAQA